jgi:hypothetical protein
VSDGPVAGYVFAMNTIETSHDPAEQVAIARQQGATAKEPTLPPDDEGNAHGEHRRLLTGANIAIGMVLGITLMLGLRIVRRRR